MRGKIRKIIDKAAKIYLTLAILLGSALIVFFIYNSIRFNKMIEVFTNDINIGMKKREVIKLSVDHCPQRTQTLVRIPLISISMAAWEESRASLILWGTQPLTPMTIWEGCLSSPCPVQTQVSLKISSSPTPMITTR